ncbi:hypothetical protein FVE85_7129 [Porphyridium purpureum]|uniref:Uncharacterized protein n=1 Tax=Porphyridium purpureum TaxID=35688 RepID=A0A5J4Z979_PORPP|nr:hypothetical protein FVE85_7129 [Porphyridium purpureum]|eukprot:POR2654..scf295_1
MDSDELLRPGPGPEPGEASVSRRGVAFSVPATEALSVNDSAGTSGRPVHAPSGGPIETPPSAHARERFESRGAGDLDTQQEAQHDSVSARESADPVQDIEKADTEEPARFEAEHVQNVQSIHLSDSSNEGRKDDGPEGCSVGTKKKSARPPKKPVAFVDAPHRSAGAGMPPRRKRDPTPFVSRKDAFSGDDEEPHSEEDSSNMEPIQVEETLINVSDPAAVPSCAGSLQSAPVLSPSSVAFDSKRGRVDRGGGMGARSNSVQPSLPNTDEAIFGMGKRAITFGRDQVREFEVEFEQLSRTTTLQSEFTRERSFDYGAELIKFEEHLAPGDEYVPNTRVQDIQLKSKAVSFGTSTGEQVPSTAAGNRPRAVRKRDPTPFVRRHPLPDHDDQDEEEEENDAEDERGQNGEDDVEEDDGGKEHGQGDRALVAESPHVGFMEPSIEEKETVRRESRGMGRSTIRKRDPTPFVPRSFLPAESDEEDDVAAELGRRESRARDSVQLPLSSAEEMKAGADERVHFTEPSLDEMLDVRMESGRVGVRSTKKRDPTPFIPRSFLPEDDEESENEENDEREEERKGRCRRSDGVSLTSATEPTSVVEHKATPVILFVEPTDVEKTETREQVKQIAVRSVRKRDPTPFIRRGAFVDGDKEHEENEEEDDGRVSTRAPESDKLASRATRNHEVTFKEPEKGPTMKGPKVIHKREPTPFVRRSMIVEEDDDGDEVHEEAGSGGQTSGKSGVTFAKTSPPSADAAKKKVLRTRDPTPFVRRHLDDEEDKEEDENDARGTGADPFSSVTDRVVEENSGGRSKAAEKAASRRVVYNQATATPAFARDVVQHTLGSRSFSWVRTDDGFQDLTGFVHLGHMYLRVSDLSLAYRFYVEVLNLTVDPAMPSCYFGKMLWLNIGRQQLRLVLCGEAQYLTGSITVTVPALQEYTAQVVESVRGFPEDTQVLVDLSDARELVVSCPWGNTLKFVQSLPGEYPLRLQCVHLVVRHGTCSAIGDFYEQIVGCVINRKGRSEVRVIVGPHQYLLFTESSKAWQEEGLVLCFYVPHFSTVLGTLFLNKLLPEKYDPDSFGGLEFDFPGVVDISKLLRGKQETILNLTHRVRSLKHAEFLRPLVNTFIWDRVLKVCAPDELAFFPDAVHGAMSSIEPTSTLPAASSEALNVFPDGKLEPGPSSRIHFGTGNALAETQRVVGFSGEADEEPLGPDEANPTKREPVGVLRKSRGEESSGPNLRDLGRSITFGSNMVKEYPLDESRTTSSINTASRSNSIFSELEIMMPFSNSPRAAGSGMGPPDEHDQAVHFKEPSEVEKEEARRAGHRVGIRSVRKREPTPFIPRAYINSDDDGEAGGITHGHTQEQRGPGTGLLAVSLLTGGIILYVVAEQKAQLRRMREGVLRDFERQMERQERMRNDAEDAKTATATAANRSGEDSGAQ